MNKNITEKQILLNEASYFFKQKKLHLLKVSLFSLLVSTITEIALLFYII